MYFEARELKSSSKPVSKDDLVEREVYFIVGFVDKKMLVPMFKPIVFIGANLEPDDKGKFYFQDYVSYSQGSTYASSGDDDQSEFHRFPEKQIGMIFTYENGLNELLKCSLRRQESNE